MTDLTAKIDAAMYDLNRPDAIAAEAHYIQQMERGLEAVK